MLVRESLETSISLVPILTAMVGFIHVDRMDWPKGYTFIVDTPSLSLMDSMKVGIMSSPP
jgi:hypothetical protein